MQILKLLAVLVPFVLLADLVWLGIIMKEFYAQELSAIVRKNSAGMAPRWGAAAMVYLIIPLGVILFVRPLIAGQSSPWQALAWGGMFGLILYGLYDMTNLAVLDKWTVRVTIADMLWGTVLCAAAALVMQTAERWMG